MKKIVCLCFGSMFVASIYSQDTTGMRPPGPTGNEQYCAEVRGGKTTVTVNGKLLRKDVIFPNGAKLTTTGMVIRKDGSTGTLKNGECVDKNSDFVKQKSNTEGRKTQ